ncbi:hypothetical protein [Sphingobium abikonense]|uniref:hypothetical protein n=1 Tax=Sphingobium abikonense TaxID=86193 RepID=UPI003515846A
MGAQFDLEAIQRVLRDATSSNGRFSQRGLSKAAGEGRDCVGDILNGRNKNPTIKVLSNLAEAMGSDISVFGITTRTEPLNAEELEEAIREALPSMPRGPTEKRARFLAEAVSTALGLPPARPSNIATDRLTVEGGSEEVSPPLGTTT